MRKNSEGLMTIARVVIAGLMLFLSLGLVRLVIGYYAAARKAGEVERSADVLLRGQNASDVDAVKLYYDYHLSRANAPLVPIWFWKFRRGELNRLWEARRD